MMRGLTNLTVFWYVLAGIGVLVFVVQLLVLVDDRANPAGPILGMLAMIALLISSVLNLRRIAKNRAKQ